MKVILVNGSPHEKGCTFTALCEVAAALNGCGVDTEIFHIGREPLPGCRACGGCGRTGKCVLGGSVVEFIEKAKSADGFVFGSPVHYAAPAGAICAFMDRAFYSGGAVMRFKPAAAVVSCRRGGASAAFDRLNKYFTINQMPIVSSTYWNSVHGSAPEDVRRDLEGLWVMRTLGKNMAWLLGCIEAGKKQGIGYPAAEKRVRTDFIR